MTYAWIIDKDYLWDGYDTAEQMRFSTTVGTIGPKDAKEEYIEMFKTGDYELLPGESWMHKFRMYDDDDELYYAGRYIGPDDDRMFGPLDDFGRADSGCTRIDYFINGKWEQL